MNPVVRVWMAAVRRATPRAALRWLLVGVWLGLLCGPGSGALPAAAQTGPASEIIQLVNQLRATRGLPPYAVSGALVAAAQAHADWMAANRSYTHTGEGGSSPQSRATAAGYAGFVAENIVGGTNLSPAQGVIWWENSPIHYQTMTSARHVHVGAGYATDGTSNFYVLVVGSPSEYAPGASAGQGQAAPEAQAEPVVITPVEVSAPREDGSIVHVVQIGQTAWDIAAAYDVDLDTLLALNHLPGDPIILPGDEIVVRPSDQATPAPEGPLIHVVQAGQSAWAIAARYGLPLEELLLLNGLGQEPVLHPGDALIIRLPEGQSPPPTPTPPTTHVVVSGETAWAIALRYGLTLEQLLTLNGLGQDPVLHPGDELLVRLPPTPMNTPEPTPTASLPSPFTEVAAVAVSPTASPSATPSPAPTLVSSPTPSPTPLAASSDAARNVGQWVIVGAVIVGVGLAALAVGVAVVGTLLERRR